MLGDLVELNFESTAGSMVAIGQTIGSIEGFKAISDLYCTVQGELMGINDQLSHDPSFWTSILTMQDGCIAFEEHLAKLCSM